MNKFNEKISTNNFFKKSYTQFKNLAKSEKIKIFLEKIELTILYFFAFVDLTFTMIRPLLLYGKTPELVKMSLPIILPILNFPLFKMFWNHPEKMFILNYIVLDYLIIHPFFGLSKLVRYNVTLIFILNLVHSLGFQYWELFFYNDILKFAGKKAMHPVLKVALSKRPLVYVHSIIAANSIILFTYFYIVAMRGKYPTCFLYEWLIDSAAIFMRIKTPTLKKNNQY